MDQVTIIFSLSEMRIRPERISDFLLAYRSSDMGSLEDDLTYLHVSDGIVQANFDMYLKDEMSLENFRQNYEKRILEIAAPMRYQLS